MSRVAPDEGLPLICEFCGCTIPEDGRDCPALDDDGEPSRNHLTVDRLGERASVVRVCNGDVPRLAECEVGQRLAAKRILDEDVFGEWRGE